MLRIRMEKRKKRPLQSRKKIVIKISKRQRKILKEIALGDIEL